MVAIAEAAHLFILAEPNHKATTVIQEQRLEHITIHLPEHTAMTITPHHNQTLLAEATAAHQILNQVLEAEVTVADHQTQAHQAVEAVVDN